MHILIVSTGYPTFYQPLNGIFYLDQARALAKAGHQVGFIAIVPTSLKDFVSKGWKHRGAFKNDSDKVKSTGEIYLQIPKYLAQRYHRSLKSGKKYFEKYLSENGKPDIIHLHGFEGGKLAIWIKRQYGIPFAVTEHSSQFLNNSLKPFQVEFAKTVFAEADLRIAVSGSFADKLKAVSGFDFKVIPNIVDTGFFIPGEKDPKFVFLSAGILNENKNHQMMIWAFQVIAPNFPEAELHIAGDGELRHMLEEMIRKMGLGNSIKLLGQLSRGELKNEMQKASCFLISSYYESFGVVAIEAMSCDVPVISTPCGGPSSIIKNGENGWITSPLKEDYARKMLEMLTNRNQFPAGVIRSYAVNNFSEEAVGKQLTDVYSRISSK